MTTLLVVLQWCFFGWAMFLTLGLSLLFVKLQGLIEDSQVAMVQQAALFWLATAVIHYLATT